jgi:hypothetical protein
MPGEGERRVARPMDRAHLLTAVTKDDCIVFLVPNKLLSVRSSLLYKMSLFPAPAQTPFL